MTANANAAVNLSLPHPAITAFCFPTLTSQGLCLHHLPMYDICRHLGRWVWAPQKPCELGCTPEIKGSRWQRGDGWDTEAEKFLRRMNEEGDLYHPTTPTYKCSFTHKDDCNLYFVTCYLTHDSWCRSQCSLLCLFPTDSVLSLRHDNTGMQTGQLCVRRVVLLKRLQRIFLLLQQLLERANTLI